MSGPFLLSMSTNVEQLKNKLVEKYIKNLNTCLSNKNSEDLPSHLKKVMPNASKQFLEWWVGFTDAEGSFAISSQQNWKYVSLRFVIEVHLDDVEVLHKIAQTLGIGRVLENKNSKTALYFVTKFEDIISVLIPIFQEFPLQTSKYLDFSCFLEAATIKSNNTKNNGSAQLSNIDLIKLKKLKESMNSKRIISAKEDKILRNKVSINKWWLLGFVEGEGTFGYKHLVPYFQIAQNEKNLFVLEAIEAYFLDTFNNSEGANLNDVGVKYTLNKGTGVYSVTIEKIDMNFKYIIPFFESMMFFSRKNLDYQYWVITVIIHKLGYYYLPEGKKIALQISSATNKYRYTTNNSLNKIGLPSEDSIMKLLDQIPPFDIFSNSSHFELIREFTIAKGGRKGFTVYIYECVPEGYKELKGSPFSTYGEGHEIIGLRRSSRTIGRYIDTGKLYNNKYIFYSTPISKEKS